MVLNYLINLSSHNQNYRSQPRVAFSLNFINFVLILIFSFPLTISYPSFRVCVNVAEAAGCIITIETPRQHAGIFPHSIKIT